jgi:N-methylhydantoinase B
MRIARLDRNGRRSELPISVDTVVDIGEKLVSEGCGGGGFGDPLDRDPDRVLGSVLAGRVSEERAGSVYGVVLMRDGARLGLDKAATQARRERMRHGASA